MIDLTKEDLKNLLILLPKAPITVAESTIAAALLAKVTDMYNAIVPPPVLRVPDVPEEQA